MSRARDLVLQLEGIARALACAPGEAELGAAIHRAIEPIVAFRGSALCVADPRVGHPRIAHIRGLDEVSLGPGCPLSAVLASGTTLLSPPQALECSWATSLGAPWLRSLVVQPLESRGRIVGALALVSDRAAAFDEFDVALSAFVAKLAGAAWERLRQESEVRLRNAVLSTLAKGTARLGQEDAFDEALQEIVEGLGTVLGCSRCYLFENALEPGGRLLTSQRYEWVAEFALALSQRVGLEHDRQQATWLAALLHDIGKLGLPPGQSWAEEPQELEPRRRYREHVERARHVLAPLDLHWPIATIVAQHHERPDGKGFPARLLRGAILKEAAIIAQADFLEHRATAIGSDAGSALARDLLGTPGARERRFDAACYDACLDLLGEQAFAFSIPGGSAP